MPGHSENGGHEDFVEQPLSSPPSPNPLAGSTNVAVSLPETVEVKLVDASVLQDYEIWSLATSILSSATVAFFVAYAQTPANQHLLYTGLVFLALMIVTGIAALTKRVKLAKKSRRIRFRLGDQIRD